MVESQITQLGLYSENLRKRIKPNDRVSSLLQFTGVRGTFFFVFCAFLFLAASPFLLFAQSTGSVSEEGAYLILNGKKLEFSGKPIHIPAHSQFAEDRKLNWLAEDVFSGKHQQAFFNIHDEYGNFGFSESAYWMKFEIDFQKSRLTDDLLLVMSAPTLDEVSLFIQNQQGDITVKESGYRFAQSTRDMLHHNYVFRIDPRQGNRFLLKAKSNTSLVLPLEAWQEQDFKQQDYVDVVVIGLYLGILLAMFFYNLFIYISTREKAYFYYILFIVFYGALQACLDGLLGVWLWRESTFFRGIDVMILPSLAAVMAILFSMSFLQTKQLLPRLHQIMNATIVLLALSSLISLITNGKGVQLTVILSLWVTVLLFFVGLSALKVGQLGARYFILAWGFLLAGTATYLVFVMGYFSNMLVLVYSMKTGSSIEIILLSLGLADRFNRERHSKEKLQIEKNEMESRTQILATVDTRTGMPNRAQLQQQLDYYRAEQQSFTLVLMKVRGFKQVNNTLGHENGDELLKLVAFKIDSTLSRGKFPALSVGVNVETLRSKVAVVDSLTFAIILSANDARQVEVAALDLREKVSGTIEFKDVVLDIEILMGMAESNPKELKTAHRIIHEAQVGLAAAAKFDRQIGLYTPLIDPYSEGRLSLMGKLRTAVQKEDLELFFQPQFSIHDLSLTGFEALLRWRDDQGNFISPADFIPLAESCGVIKPLTRWVIRESILRLVEIQKHKSQVMVSINLSVSNLREEDLIKYIVSQIRELKVLPETIQFEITESSMIENEEVALNRLLQLRRIGCQISIDDYGSGYASLAYLKQLPISEVKIDRSFIQDLSENVDDQVIVRSTILMCHDLGLKVVAEGIESETVLTLLKGFECDIAQGFFLGKPRAFSEQALATWLKQPNP